MFKRIINFFDNNDKLFTIIGFIIAVTAFIISKTLTLPVLVIVLYVLAYLFVAYKVLIECFENIFEGNFLDETFLMVLSSVAAYAIAEFAEGFLVIFLYNIGEYLEDLAVDKSIDRISSLSSLKVDNVTLLDGSIKNISDVIVGDNILVKAGERIPLDGIVVYGSSSIDTKFLTGESLPIDVNENDLVYSGTINLSNVLTIKVLKSNEDSESSKIINLIEEARTKKAKSEEFITKFAKIYTPIVIFLAICVFIIEAFFIDVFSIKDALNNAIVFLVSSCPCALLISIPLTFFGGIGKCSSFGILIKGGNYIESLSKAKYMYFDKTGTLTKGNFKVKEVIPNNIDKEELIKIAASCEINSNHPIAKTIASYYNGELIKFNNIEEIPGQGLICCNNEQRILIGNAKLLFNNHILFIESIYPSTVIYCAKNNEYIGCIHIEDEIKEESYSLINNLTKKHIISYMLTGDQYKIAEDVSKKLNIKEFYAGLLPLDKVKIIEKSLNNKKKNESVCFVGDGINDTPSITIADCGIAVSGFGNDIACENADIVLLGNNISNIDKAIDVSKKTMTILYENIIFAIIIKLIALIVGVLGILGSYGMLFGVFADVGVCFIVILNSLRIIFNRRIN